MPDLPDAAITADPAREAAFVHWPGPFRPATGGNVPQVAHSWTPETRSAYEAGREKGRADEREACAQLAEQHGALCTQPEERLGDALADLIRARTSP